VTFCSPAPSVGPIRCPTDAIEYVRLAGTTQRAADLLEQRCQDPNCVGKVRLVCKFAGEIPQHVLRRYRGILLTLAWRLSRNLRFKEVAELIDAADARLQELEESREMPARDLRHLRYVLQHREMVLAGVQDDAAKAEDLCHALLREYSGEQHPYLHGNIYSHLLAAQREQYKIADLERTAAIACGVMKRSNYCQAAVGLQASIGPSLFMAGLTGRAREVFEQGRLESISYSGRSSSATSACSLALGELAYESNEIDLAEQLVNEGLPSARECGFVDQLQSGFLTQSRIRAVRRDVGAALSTLDDGMALGNERDLERLRLALTAERVRLLIQSGALDKALIEAQEQHVSLDDPSPLPGAAPTTRDEQRANIWVRLAQASDKLFSAIVVARRWRSFSASRGAVRSLIRWNILLAQLHFLSAGHRAAQRSLREALDYGASGRMLRSFLDEGPLMQTLLSAASNGEIESPRPADVFACELLTHFEGRPPKPEHAQKLSTDAECFCGHLSPKEREILSLVGVGMSNREVAEQIGVTEGTVKWYLQQVYDKVGTRRRQQAVQRARQFGLIAS
jgi:LuxR family maltose regulon positive regulatory protein